MAEKKGYNRRDFLKIIGASGGMAATGCAKDVPEKLLPYVVQPNDVIPGVSTWYAGTCGECATGCGVLVRTREGRAVKVEGNPAHPINRGGLCAIGQSALQGLYDPDRVREPLKRSVLGAYAPLDWKAAVGELAKTIDAAAKSGKEVTFVTRPLGLSEKALLETFQSAVKGSTHIEYSLLSAESLEQATANIFGAGLEPRVDFAKADVVLGVGADYLETWLSPVAQTKGFASRRRPRRDGKTLSISKVFHVEPRLSLTAANADVWFKNTPGSEHRVLQALLVELSSGSYTVSAAARAQVKAITPATTVESLLEGTGLQVEQLQQMARTLAESQRSLVVAGGSAASGSQSVLCAELALAINYLLGNIGETVLLLPTERRRPERGYSAMRALAKRLEANEVAAVVLVGVNPVYTLPSELKFAQALGKAAMVVSLGTQMDETAMLSHLVLPGLTAFESWNDAEPVPGIFNLNQPAMQPLYAGQSFGDLLVALSFSESLTPVLGDDALGKIDSFYDYLREQWKKRYGQTGFEERWISAVERGGDWQSRRETRKGLSARVGEGLLASHPLASPKQLTMIAFPTVRLGDGSVANRPWQQEIPDPITTAVWGSWIEVHPSVAEDLGLKHGDVARLRTPYGSIEAPLYVTKHIQERTLGVPIGQGHDGFGRFATGVGANPLAVLAAPEGMPQFWLSGVSLEKSISKDTLVITHGHDSQLDRGLQRTVGLAELSAKGGHYDDHHHGHESTAALYGLPALHHHDTKALGPQKEPRQMYTQMEHVQYRWGMSVDLSSCTGCSACVTACYAENNVPVVGKDQCEKGREMSWIRIERYLDGEDTSPVTAFSPVMCQHCNNAPCEPVCPVYATYHNEEGLNTMVYNRCVGTRYCSNNCSYKVRRFNWFKYEWPEPLTWQLNPDVTVREVGVMEKCTFCIQRIKDAQNKAKDLGRPVQDGEVQPACASSCPADAISFGNLKDKNSRVYKQSQDERSYRMLNVELNTQPSVYYLAKVVHKSEQKDKSH